MRRPSGRGTDLRRPPRPAGGETDEARAIRLYRELTGYGWTMRLSLAVSLVLLLLSWLVRDAGGSPPNLVAGLGLGFLFAFLSVAGIKHYRALYRMRRHHPGSWMTSGRFLRAMIGAPFGAGDPAATRRDVLLLRASAMLGILVLVAALVGGILRR